MSQATYRGCKYNTDTPKQEYQNGIQKHMRQHIQQTLIVVFLIVLAIMKER